MPGLSDAAPSIADIEAALIARGNLAQASALPQPASSVPPMEVPGGAPGGAATYRRSDAVQPRITRSATVTLDSNGTATFDWTAQGALATPVQVSLAPVYTGSGVPIAWVTAVSATAVSIKCVISSTATLNLSLITAGLNLYAAGTAGMQVTIIAVPTS